MYVYTDRMSVVSCTNVKMLKNQDRNKILYLNLLTFGGDLKLPVSFNYNLPRCSFMY